MPKGRNAKQAKKNSGGTRRTAHLPCGHIVQGQPQRLKQKISAHQKVCVECASHDCSYLWNKEFAKCPNITSLQGSNSGCCNQYNTTQRFSAWDADAGVEVSFTQDKVGGCAETLLAAEDAIRKCPPTKVKSTNNKKKKGKKKQKKPKVQSDWGASQDTEETTIVIGFENDEVDEDFYKVLQSITADLSMDEIVEALTSRGAEVVEVPFSPSEVIKQRLEVAKDSVIGL